MEPDQDNVVGLAPTQRERAKSDRRRRIVDAACALLREVGLEALSGKMIAAQAGVSLSTVYNLFGSKQAVLAAVFDDDLAHYAALVSGLRSASALERLFDAVDVAADLYLNDPAFYRATMWRRPATEHALDAALRQPRIAFWRDMVEAARAEGQLRLDADAAIIGLLMIRLFSATLEDWIADEVSVEQLRVQMKFGFAVILSPFAIGPAEAALRSRMAELQAAAMAPPKTRKARDHG